MDETDPRQWRVGPQRLLYLPLGRTFRRADGTNGYHPRNLVRELKGEVSRQKG